MFLSLVLNFWVKKIVLFLCGNLFPFVLEIGLILVQAGLELTVYPRLTLNLKQPSYQYKRPTSAGFCCTFIVLYVAGMLTYGEKINKNPNTPLEMVVFKAYLYIHIDIFFLSYLHIGIY